MTTADSLLFPLLAVTCIAGWTGVIFVIPWCQRSRYRYRLWQMRDQIVDDVICNKIPSHPAVVELVARIETHIRCVDSFTLASTMTEYIGRRAFELPVDGSLDVTLLGSTEGAIISRYLSEFNKAKVRHLFVGSPSGWIAFALVPSAFVIAELLRRLTHMRQHERRAGPVIRVVESRVRKGVVHQAETWEAGHTAEQERGELSSCI